MSAWIERELVLPEGVSALPGRVRLWPYQKEIADAISDPLIEKVTLVKPVRVGFTTLLTGAIGSYIANEPAPILVLLPTESDARDFTVSDIEPTFGATPVLRGLLDADSEDGGRNTLLHRRFPGGALKIVAARAPRNLRRHTARILLCDEVDAMEIGAEGNPIRLAERRTLSFANRKIVIGSTPLFTDTSAVLRSYAESDGRVYELPCPDCGAFHEISWADIEWPSGHPEKAAYRCPSCKELISERHKAEMVEAGRWRATRPEIRGHAGFRLNALVSLLANASWGRLAGEFLACRDDPSELQTFVNTILGQGWNSPGTELDDVTLQARAEDFGMDKIPPEVLILTSATDVQDDRLETSLLGYTRNNECLALAHIVMWGPPASDPTVWIELDRFLKSGWRHPHGGVLKIDAAFIDSGAFTQTVYDFAFPRLSRRVFACKGLAGARPFCQFAKVKHKTAAHGGRLVLVGADTIKQAIFQRLEHGRTIRFSKSLEAVYYEQLASERRIIRYVKGRPVRRFERKSSRARAEALDCLVYGLAAREIVRINLDQREQNLRNRTPATQTILRVGPGTTAIGDGKPVWNFKTRYDD